ncbi:hypothetical protein GW17_00050759 [Ensete ventricosum]|nr:hypothetical protein GW17_00050759 [Ensete ventricosum]
MEPKTARNRHVSILCSCSPESFNGTDISRSIVLCLAYSLEPTFPTALSNVLNAGGKGLIVAQFTINVLEITKDCSGIICVLVDFDTGYQIGKYIRAERQITSGGRGTDSQCHRERSAVSKSSMVLFERTGHTIPRRSEDPGLVYDIDPKEYYKFFNCTTGRFEICAEVLEPVYYLNLPSISIPDLKTTAAVWRTVTNVGEEVDAVYKASIEPPPGVQMAVEPPTLVFNATAKVRSFKVTFVATHKVQGDYMFGSLTWLDGGGAHAVRMPIAVRVVIRDFYADVA